MADNDTAKKGIDALLITLLEKMSSQQERDLRWKNVRFFVFALVMLLGVMAYAGAGFYFSQLGKEVVDGEYVALLKIEGVIDSEGRNNSNKIIPALVKAFRDKEAKGIVLLINSPGGEPVESSLIYDRIMELRSQYPEKRVIAVGRGMMTSAAYWIASSADEIYVNRSTLTGSVGVISSQFGFANIMQRFGVERRVFTAGTNKNRLDQFLPLRSDDTTKIGTVLTDIHQHFIQAVEEGRKGKLKGDHKQLFSGDFWTGDQAVKLGLVDGTADLYTVLKTKFNVEATSDFTPMPTIFERFSKGLSMTLKDALVESNSLTFY